MQARDGIDALPLFLDTQRSLSEQLDEAKAKHSGLRAILLTTPNNPTGEVLPAKGESVHWTCSHLGVVIQPVHVAPRWAVPGTTPNQPMPHAIPVAANRSSLASAMQRYKST